MEPFYTYSFLTLLVIIVILFFGIWNNGYFRRRGVNNVEPPFPFLGNIMSVVTRKEQFALNIDRLYRAFPNDDYIGFFEFIKPNILIRNLELLQDICKKDFQSFHDHRTFVDGDADPIFGNFLISLKGEKWRKMRKTLGPLFTRNKLSGMYQFIWKCGNQLSDYLSKQMKTSKNGNGILEIDISDALKKHTMDIISSIAFGVEINSHEDPNTSLYRCGMEIAHLKTIHLVKVILHSAIPKIMKFFDISIYKKSLIKFFNELVHNSIDYRITNNLSRADMIDILKDAKKEINDVSNGSITRKWTDYDLSAQAVLFFVGGYETTSLISSFMIYELTINPEVQRRLQTEIDETILMNDNITFDVLNNMKYMDMVLSETMRLWPPVGCIDRDCVKEYIIPKKYNRNNVEFKIKKSQSICIPIYSIHRDPKNYPDPDTFNPERFSDKNKSSINPLAYLPFGIGPRQCIGIRYATNVIKLSILQLFSKFDFVITEKTPIPLVIDTNSFLLKSNSNYWIGMKERKKLRH